MREWAGETSEPSLEEIFQEPIVAALMRSDGVERPWLERLLAGLKSVKPTLSEAAAA